MRHKYVLFSSLISGILANLYMFTNKISFHDDIGSLFSVGATYSSGRWFLGILGKIVSLLFGNYSLPMVEGILTIFFIALSSVFIIDIFSLKDKMSCCLIGAIMSVFPTVFATFAYMFTAPYYYFALLLSVLSVYVVQQFKFGFFPAVCLIACSVGIYQAFFPVSVSLFLGLLIMDAIQTEANVPAIVVRGIRYLLTLVSGLILYLLLTNLFCWLTGIPLSNYKGINSMGNLELSQIPILVKTAYVSWLALALKIGSLACSRFANILYLFFNCTIVVVAMVNCMFIWKKDKFKAVILLLMFLLFPLAVNLIYVMSPEGVNVLMTYSFVIAFILLVALAEKQKEYLSCIYSKVCKFSISGIVICLILIYIQYANVEYLRADFLQKQAHSYFTTLITQIKSTEGYTQGNMPITFVGSHSDIGLDKTFLKNEYNTGVYPKELKVLINDYRWKEYMMKWCGYSAPIVDGKEYSQLPEVQEMSTYPGNNSIKVINGVVVVKLS